jgi:hypothetical protein
LIDTYHKIFLKKVNIIVALFLITSKPNPKQGDATMDELPTRSEDPPGHEFKWAAVWNNKIIAKGTDLKKVLKNATKLLNGQKPVIKKVFDM